MQAKLVEPLPQLVVQALVLSPDGLQALLSHDLEGLPHAIADRDEGSVMVNPLVLAKPAPCVGD